MLRLALPKGSLEEQTLRLFEDADLTVQRANSRDYRPTIDDPRIAEVRILRPQEIPCYVQQGYFDLGITGLDWIQETLDLLDRGELQADKARGRQAGRGVMALVSSDGAKAP